MGKTKRVAGDEDQLIVGIELMARVTIVGVEPQAIVITFNIEQVQITVRIRNVQSTIQATAP